MRERLIELLKQINFDYCEECFYAATDGYKCAPDLAEFFADHLLANGVIVPPCKVGQTVYGVDTYDFEIIPRKFNMHMLFRIGQDIFLTREEAEEALARMEGEQR